jgi:hypothetical protein
VSCGSELFIVSESFVFDGGVGASESDSEDEEEDLEIGTESLFPSDSSGASKRWKDEAELREEFEILVRARCTMTSVWICWARNIRSFDVLIL